jgi:hypothetical protein
MFAPWQDWMKLGWEGLLVTFSKLQLHRIPILYVIKPLVPKIRSTLYVLFAVWLVLLVYLPFITSSSQRYKLEQRTLANCQHGNMHFNYYALQLYFMEYLQRILLRNGQKITSNFHFGNILNSIFQNNHQRQYW